MLSMLAGIMLQAAAPLPPPAPPPPPPPRGKARARANLAALLSNDDYPVEALRNGVEGVVSFRLQVGADGRVTGCAITQSSGSDLLDSTTCRLLSARARFSPARDRRGGAAAGVGADRLADRGTALTAVAARCGSRRCARPRRGDERTETVGAGRRARPCPPPAQRRREAAGGRTSSLRYDADHAGRRRPSPHPARPRHLIVKPNPRSRCRRGRSSMPAHAHALFGRRWTVAPPDHFQGGQARHRSCSAGGAGRAPRGGPSDAG